MECSKWLHSNSVRDMPIYSGMQGMPSEMQGFVSNGFSLSLPFLYFHTQNLPV